LAGGHVNKPDRPEWLTAAQCASRTGFTVRALRVYEEYGLITPGRSAGGWRLYGPDELVRLNTISLLKTAGLSLTQIRDLSQSSPRRPSLQQILQGQLGTWNTRYEDAGRGRAITQAALDRLSTHGSLSTDELCNLIRSFEMSQTTAAVAPTAQEPDDVVLDQAVLDDYVGDYAPHAGEFGIYRVARHGENLLMQMTMQPVALQPLSETEFAIRSVPWTVLTEDAPIRFGVHLDAQIQFERNAQGQVSSVIMRQYGAEILAPRIDSATERSYRARLGRRIENKTPVPGSDAALRRLIEGVMNGSPNYGKMTATMAQLFRRQLPSLQPLAAYLGLIRSIEFLGVGGQGWDVYDVHRENGTGRWRIAVTLDGIIVGAQATLTSPLTLGP
jgi:DNA-binding transcriptional MerR regulator